MRGKSELVWMVPRLFALRMSIAMAYDLRRPTPIPMFVRVPR